MRSIRGICLSLSILFVLVFLGWASWLNAKVVNISDQALDSIVVKVPPGILDDLLPFGTPGPTPTVEPTATPEVPDPEGYQLDANDYLAVVTADGLKLNVNGLALDNLAGYSSIKFEMTPKGDAEPMAVYLSVWAKGEGKYDLRLADYDTGSHSAALKISGAMGEQSLELKPKSRILFSAQYLEAILFDGEAAPGPGVHPSHYMAMETDEMTVLAGKDGKIVLESRPVPGSYTPPPATPGNSGNNPPLGPSGGNPSTSNPPGGSLDDGPNIPPGFNGQLGGSSMLGCGLGLGAVSPTSLPTLLLLSLMFSVALRLRGRSK